jgi:hypothetical protein
MESRSGGIWLSSFFLPLELHHTGAGAAGCRSFLMCCLYRSLVISRSLTLFESDRTGGTSRQAVTETVAEVLPDQFCFSVYHIYGTLMAGSGAQSAPVALFFIDLDDFSDHF